MLQEAQEPRASSLRELLSVPGGQIWSEEQPNPHILTGLDHHGALHILVHGSVHGHVQVLYGNAGRLQRSQRIRLPLQHGVEPHPRVFVTHAHRNARRSVLVRTRIVIHQKAQQGRRGVLLAVLLVVLPGCCMVVREAAQHSHGPVSPRVLLVQQGRALGAAGTPMHAAPGSGLFWRIRTTRFSRCYRPLHLQSSSRGPH
ncbi:hypothetical protein [Streptomyces sp. MNP-20]|uniref:hypothetical protein n=1 Tax=Streptomyces sp. MNP-20 TaxID=2721165 RepID=UPI001555F211|nr:hypothetical protein [Streptomyces sp. MNP-20]